MKYNNIKNLNIFIVVSCIISCIIIFFQLISMGNIMVNFNGLRFSVFNIFIIFFIIFIFIFFINYYILIIKRVDINIYWCYFFLFIIFLFIVFFFTINYYINLLYNNDHHCINISEIRIFEYDSLKSKESFIQEMIQKNYIESIFGYSNYKLPNHDDISEIIQQELSSNIDMVDNSVDVSKQNYIYHFLTNYDKEWLTKDFLTVEFSKSELEDLSSLDNIVQIKLQFKNLYFEKLYTKIEQLSVKHELTKEGYLPINSITEFVKNWSYIFVFFYFFSLL